MSSLIFFLINMWPYIFIYLQNENETKNIIWACLIFGKSVSILTQIRPILI